MEFSIAAILGTLLLTDPRLVLPVRYGPVNCFVFAVQNMYKSMQRRRRFASRRV